MFDISSGFWVRKISERGDNAPHRFRLSRTLKQASRAFRHFCSEFNPDVKVNPLLESAWKSEAQRRANWAIWIGIPLYALNTIEPWLRYHDRIPVLIQLTTSFILLCLGCLCATSWGATRRAAIFTAGFFISVGGFASIICYKKAFNTIYSDSFATFFAFYTVVLPTTVTQSFGVGVGTLAILTVPQFIITGNASDPLAGVWTPFFILLCGRAIANRLWVKEFAATRLYADFVGGISHDFRNSLSVLILTAEQLLSGKYPDGSSRISAYNRVRSNTLRLIRRVEGLLKFGRMEAGLLKWELEVLDPIEILELVVREFQLDPESNRDHEVRLSLLDNTPLILADRAGLESVLWNLLENAAKYSPRCSHITVVAERIDEQAVIRVIDSGFGIPKAELPELFRKFSRGSYAKANDIPGSGIGLSLAQWIVKAFGGEITVTSELGKGTTFSIILPGVV